MSSYTASFSVEDQQFIVFFQYFCYYVVGNEHAFFTKKRKDLLFSFFFSFTFLRWAGPY